MLLALGCLFIVGIILCIWFVVVVCPSKGWDAGDREDRQRP